VWKYWIADCIRKYSQGNIALQPAKAGIPPEIPGNFLHNHVFCRKIAGFI
jgi:hypothetical protein